jgi:hypothetical protein
MKVDNKNLNYVKEEINKKFDHYLDIDDFDQFNED